jgi:hypothetical protein
MFSTFGEYTNRSLTEATVTIVRLASGARQSQGIAWTSESFRYKQVRDGRLIRP